MNEFELNPESTSLTERIFKVLQDDTRLAIFIYLTVYQKLTLKELSYFLHKGKTTVHHHMRKLEEIGIVKWEEKAEDRKKLKTRFYSLNYDNLRKSMDQYREEVDLSKLSESEKLELKDSVFGWMKLDSLVTTNLMDWMIDFTEEQLEAIDLPTLDKRKESFIRTFALTKKTLPIYKDFEKKMLETIDKTKPEQVRNEESLPITHISALMFVPIKEILEWRQTSNQR